MPGKDDSIYLEKFGLLVNGLENSLWDYYFSCLKSCLGGVCWHPLLNTPRVILKKACCTASSPNNLKLSSPESNRPCFWKERVIRGGSFESGEQEIQVSRREKADPNKPEPFIGFRIVVK